MVLHAVPVEREMHHRAAAEFVGEFFVELHRDEGTVSVTGVVEDLRAECLESLAAPRSAHDVGACVLVPMTSGMSSAAPALVSPLRCSRADAIQLLRPLSAAISVEARLACIDELSAQLGRAAAPSWCRSPRNSASMTRVSNVADFESSSSPRIVVTCPNSSSNIRSFFAKQSVHAFVDGSARVQIRDEHLVARLRQPVDAADALLDAHRVPRQVVVEHAVAELEVLSLGAGVGRDHDRRLAGPERGDGGCAFGRRHRAVERTSGAVPLASMRRSSPVTVSVCWVKMSTRPCSRSQSRVISSALFSRAESLMSMARWPTSFRTRRTRSSLCRSAMRNAVVPIENGLAVKRSARLRLRIVSDESRITLRSRSVLNAYSSRSRAPEVDWHVDRPSDNPIDTGLSPRRADHRAADEAPQRGGIIGSARIVARHVLDA